MKQFLACLAIVAIALMGCSKDEGGGDNGGGVETKKQCNLPWGGLLDHGAAVAAYQASSVPAGQSCVSEFRTCNDGVLSGSFSHKECAVGSGSGQNPGEELHVRVDAEGKKWGGMKIVEDQSLWKVDGWHGDRPACGANVALGGLCNEPHASCKLPDGTKLICQNEKLYKIWGWVYEKEGTAVTPLANVKLDIFWFAGCMAGICNPMAPAVTSNSNGYFEIFTGSLLDTLRIHSPSGYFGLCNVKKPISGGGMYIGSLKPGDGTGGFVQYKLKADSCAFGVPQ